MFWCCFHTLTGTSSDAFQCGKGANVYVAAFLPGPSHNTALLLLLDLGSCMSGTNPSGVVRPLGITSDQFLAGGGAAASLAALSNITGVPPNQIGTTYASPAAAAEAAASRSRKLLQQQVGTPPPPCSCYSNTGCCMRLMQLLKHCDVCRSIRGGGCLYATCTEGCQQRRIL